MKRISSSSSLLLCHGVDGAVGGFRYARIDELTGLKGKLNEKEGVYRVTFPRADVKVSVDGWTMPPFMGLGTWAAFTQRLDTRKRWSWATWFYLKTK